MRAPARSLAAAVAALALCCTGACNRTTIPPGPKLYVSNEMGAFTVVRAESHEAAAKMFENHPHFSIFPGEAVEIMPVLPIPAG